MEEYEEEISNSDDQFDESSGDSISEDEQEIENKNNKRKSDLNYSNNKRIKVDNEVNGLKSKQKKSKNDLHKAPTAEELSHLQQTENLFKSNLFRLQIEQLLTEVNVKQKYQNIFNVWFENFEKFLENLPENEVQLSVLIKKKTKVSTIVHTRTDQDILLKFVKPEQCRTFGLQKINAVVGPELTVDINLTMPKNCFLEKDYLNNRFVVKREYYMWYMHAQLLKSNLCSSVSCNPQSAVLEIVPKTSKKIKIHLYITPAENSFKLSRFEPDKNNIRENLFDTFSDVDIVKLKNHGTPYYNSVLLHDLTLVSNYDFLENTLKELQNVQDGIKLLTVWLQRRDLHLNGFSNDLLAQTILYLTLKRKINKHMSSYQVVRNFWVFLSTTNWHENPISICEDVKSEKFKTFRENFDIVFLDKSGSYNLTAFLYLDVYMKIRSEAALAVHFLDDNRLDSFSALFMMKMNPEVQYDALLRLKDSQSFKNIYDEINDDTMKYTYVGCYRPLIVKRILHFLKKGLNKRIVHIVPLGTQETEELSLQDIIFGLTLNPSGAFTGLEKGPSSNSPEALNFGKFWGNLAECRRFADGSICEVVYFPTKTSQEKRQVFKKVIDYVVTEKLKVEKHEIISDEFEQMLVLKDYITPFPTGTCEEASLKIISIFDELSKKLREFTLPLEITTVQGASEVFSYTDVFPPVPTNYKWGGKMTAFRENNIILKEDVKLGTVPRYVAPIECVIQLGMNSKWPSNVEALRQLKIGFYLEISKLLQQSDIVSNTKSKYLDVFYKGLVFRFSLYHPKELSLLKKYTKPDGIVAYKDTEESIEMDKNLNILPKIIGALNGVQSQNPSYGPSTALIKRWLRSQLIDEFHIPDIVICLLNAFLYLNSAPYNNANLPQVAFLRFLQFIMNFDWNLQLVAVNFNNELSKESLDSFETSFQEKRQNYPPLYIVTPFDEGKSLFSKKCTKEILKRLSILAKATYDYVHVTVAEQKLSTIKELFVPNLEGYDLLIHLRPLMNPRRHQQLKFETNDDRKIQLEEYDEKQSTKLPVVGFNPVGSYLKELRENYGDFALFFYDPYGGNTIGVLWQPNVFEKKDFKVPHVGGRKIVDKKLILNTAAIIEDFYVLGNGLVKTIEQQNQ